MGNFRTRGERKTEGVATGGVVMWGWADGTETSRWFHLGNTDERTKERTGGRGTFRRRSDVPDFTSDRKGKMEGAALLPKWEKEVVSRELKRGTRRE